MKIISSTTECFIHEQIELKFKKKLDALKEKKRLANEKLSDLCNKIDELERQQFNIGDLTDHQADEVEGLKNDLVDIIKKACEKTIAARLKKIGLKMVDAKKTVEYLLDSDGLFDAIDNEHIVNVSTVSAKIKKQIQKLESDRSATHDKSAEIDIEINELNEKIDKCVKDIVIKLELGGNYDDLMKMIKEVKV